MSNTLQSCPIDGFQRFFAGKYKLRIIWDLKNGALRYSEIVKSLQWGAPSEGHISPRVVSRELKMLVALNIVNRTDFKTAPPKVEYRLTATGVGLLPIIAQIHDWGVQNF